MQRNFGHPYPQRTAETPRLCVTVVPASLDQLPISHILTLRTTYLLRGRPSFAAPLDLLSHSTVARPRLDSTRLDAHFRFIFFFFWLFDTLRPGILRSGALRASTTNGPKRKWQPTSSTPRNRYPMRPPPSIRGTTAARHPRPRPHPRPHTAPHNTSLPRTGRRRAWPLRLSKPSSTIMSTRRAHTKQPRRPASTD